MRHSIHDYLLDQQGIDWSQALASWSWLLPTDLTIWLVNRFGDLFIVLDDGSVQLLDVGTGSLTRLADSRDDFAVKIDTPDYAAQWLLIPLVDALVHAGTLLKPHECYGYKTLPALDGDCTADNFAPIALDDYIGACGSILGQIRDLPDGAKVTLKVDDQPG